LTAPSDSVVEVVSVRPGDLVPAGRIVLTMLEASQLWVKVYVPETDLAHVRVGQQAAVRVDCFGGRSFEGHVGQISSQAEFLPRNVQTKSDREHQVFGVKVYVDNAQQILKSGMSATVRLERPLSSRHSADCFAPLKALAASSAWISARTRQRFAATSVTCRRSLACTRTL